MSRPVSRAVLVLACGLATVCVGAAGPAHANDGATGKGTFYAAGFNGSGELADGTTTSRETFAVGSALPLGTTVTAVAAGDFFSLVATSTGEVYSVGYNGDGELGDGTTKARTTPVKVQGFPVGTVVTALAAGAQGSFALTSTGAVYGWGNNDLGEIGDGTTTVRLTATPVTFPEGTTITAIAAGAFHTVALTSSGQVYAWGAGGDGELGTGDGASSSLPVLVHFAQGVVVTAISSSYYATAALTSDGQVYSWGSDYWGQIGNGAFMVDARSPYHVQGLLAGVTATAVSVGNQDMFALGSDGSVYSWGQNGGDLLGNGQDQSAEGRQAVPGLVVGIPTDAGVVAIAAGGSATYVRTADSKLYGWGAPLGDMSGTVFDTAQALAAPSAITAFSAAADQVLLLAGPPAPLTQAITFSSTAPTAALVTQTYTVAATGGASGLPVTFSSGSPTVCTVAGSAVSLVAAGTCTVDADQAGDDTYASAPQVSQSFAVARTPQSITFAALPGAGVVGGTTALAATGGGSGQPVVFSTATPSTCAVIGSAVTFINAGSCVVDADQGGTTAYDAAPQASHSFTVTAGVLAEVPILVVPQAPVTPPVVVAPPVVVTPPVLPFTGSPTRELMLLGMGLVGAGGALLRGSRRLRLR